MSRRQVATATVPLAGAAFLAAGVIGAAGGGISRHLHSATDYATEMLFVAGALLAIGAVAELARHTTGRAGAVGATLMQLGLGAMAVGGTATMVTADDRALGPVFMLGLLASVVGVLLLAVALTRGAMAAWVGPVLAVAWIAWPLNTGLLVLPGLALLAAYAALTRGPARETALAADTDPRPA